MKKRLLILAAVLIAAAVTYLASGSRNNTGGSIRASGIVEGTEVNLSSKVPGRIRSICCREGDAVKEGQIVIELDSDDLKASAAQARAGVERARADIASAESSVENALAAQLSAEADVKSAEADLEKARVQMDELRLERDRARELHQKDFIARSSLDQAAAAFDAAAASHRSSQAHVSASLAKKEAAASQVRAARGQLLSVRARLKEAEAALSFSESRLQDTVIASPIAGVLIFRSLEKGEQAAVGSTIVTIVNTTDRYARIDLEETAVAAFPLNAEAQITAEGLAGKSFRGRVTEIGKHAEFATQRDVTRGRQDIKTFRVKISLEDPEGLLKPGMTVAVEIPKRP